MLFGQLFTHVMWFLFCASLVPLGATRSGKVLTHYASFEAISIVSGKVIAVPRYPTNSGEEYGVRFTFSLDGKTYSGETVMSDLAFSVGQIVAIELRGDDPSTATIEGYPDWIDLMFALVLLMFPIGFGAILSVWIRDGYKKIQLLRYGHWVERELRSHPDDEESGWPYDYFMYVVSVDSDGVVRPAGPLLGCAVLWPLIAAVGLWLVF
jgi:hypothetical protein